MTPPLLALIFRFDAAVGCFFEKSFLQRYLWLAWVALAVNLAVVFMGITMRVRDEEAMLKEKFGDEWVEWNRKTKRFIPYII